MNTQNKNNEQINFLYDNDGFVPTIEEEDLEDVSEDVDLSSLGPATIAADIELQSIGVPDKDLTASQRKPHTSELLGTSLHSSGDDLLNEPVYQFHRKKKETARRNATFALVVFVALAISLAIAIIIPVARKIDDRNVEKKIHNEGSAYAFDENDEFGPLTNEESSSLQAAAIKEDKDTNVKIIDSKIDLGDKFPDLFNTNFVDFAKLPFVPENEIPFFWQIPNSGSSMQSIMTACDHLILASNTGHKEDINPESLQKIRIKTHEYVNVNLGHPEGIAHAAELGLVPSRLADVVATHHLYYAGKMLFSKTYKARAFTMIRHPIERALSTYHAIQLHSKKDEIKNMTLTEYVDSEHVETNWLTRFLTNRRQDGKLEREHVEIAKEILRQKFLIGLYDHFEESIYRIENFFGWKVTSPPGKVQGTKLCHDRLVENARQRDKDDVDFLGTRIKKGDMNYLKLKALNEFDLELYWYAVQLFKEQEELLKDIIVGVSP